MSEEFKPTFIAERLEMRILIGVASMTAMIILLGWIAINENSRMDEFTERSQGRSIEAGARIFENNCASCHGHDGLGLPGRAPALNNPHLFGYNYFADIDSEVNLINAQIDAATDAEEILRLQGELDLLEAQRTALQETILYDFSDQVERIDEELAALDEEIVQLEGVDDASRLPLYISQRETAELVPLQQELDNLITIGTPEEPEEPEAADVEAEGEEADAAEEPEAADAETTDEAAAEEPEAAEAEGDEAGAEEAADEAAQEGEPTQTPEEAEAEAAIAAVLADYPLLTEGQAQRFVEIENEIAAVNESLAPYNNLKAQRDALLANRAEYLRLTDAQRHVESLRAELAEVEAQIAALTEIPEDDEDFVDPDAAEREELTNQAAELRSEIDNADIERINVRNELLAAGLVQEYDPTQPSRLVQVAWSGTLNDFVEGTLTGGRPTSKSYWPEPMPAWAQLAGGPLRSDQIRNLTDYVLNFNRDFTIRDLHDVQQMARIPLSGASSGPPLNTTNVTLVIQTLDEQLEAGDIDPGVPEDGQAVFTSMGCAGCHGVQNGTGPALTGMWTRASGNQDDRLTTTGFEDNPEHYLIQSIIDPSAFVVPDFPDGVMPPDFNTRLSYQDLANLLAFLETQE